MWTGATDVMSVNLFKEPRRAAPASQPLHFGLAWSAFSLLPPSWPPQSTSLQFCFLFSLSLCVAGLVLKPVNILKATPQTASALNAQLEGKECPRIGGPWEAQKLPLLELLVDEWPHGGVRGSSQRGQLLAGLLVSFALQYWGVCVCVHAYVCI